MDYGITFAPDQAYPDNYLYVHTDVQYPEHRAELAAAWDAVVLALHRLAERGVIRDVEEHQLSNGNIVVYRYPHGDDTWQKRNAREHVTRELWNAHPRVGSMGRGVSKDITLDWTWASCDRGGELDLALKSRPHPGAELHHWHDWLVHGDGGECPDGCDGAADPLRKRLYEHGF